jgi:lipopolysaccharide heptosyltransferase II
VKQLHPEKIQNLLIRGTNWVGDSVMAIPALREIRRIFKRAHISLLVRPWVRDVYSAVDFVDSVLVYDKDGVHHGLGGGRRLISDLRRHGYDGAILLQNAMEAAIIAFCAGIPCRIGYARDGRGVLLTHPAAINPELHKLHQAYYYLGILYSVGLLTERPWEPGCNPIAVEIGVRDEDLGAARQLLRDCGIERGRLLVGLNPGAYYGGAKRWLSDRYAAVADSLAERFRAQVLIFGSSGERDIANEIASAMKFQPVIFAGRTTLGQLMGLIKECGLLITNDSGPMHLAAALGVSQIAIFGSTSEIATGPLSPKAEVIKHPVECSPCFLRECPIDFPCMKGITVERVLRAAEAKLTGICD